VRWHLTVLALLVTALVPWAAPAYTIVLRGGERVDIGEFYWLSGSNMTWVTPGGERLGVDLGRIDLDATASYNGEAVSEFVSRAIRRGTAIVSTAPVPISSDESRVEPITITTADLAPLRDERERDAAARPSAPTVLPPVGVPRDEEPAAPDAVAFEERWREEARLLREEVDVERVQIEAIRSEIAYREANPRKFRLSHEYNYGRGAIVVDRRGLSRYPSYGYGTGSAYSRSEEELSQLNSRLIDLEIRYRGTLLRWDAFVERARRAGVPPGWLRE
jgi:hypothetical protein